MDFYTYNKIIKLNQRIIFMLLTNIRYFASISTLIPKITQQHIKLNIHKIQKNKQINISQIYFGTLFKRKFYDFASSNFLTKKFVQRWFNMNKTQKYIDMVQQNIKQLIPSKFKKLAFLYRYLNYPQKYINTLLIFNYSDPNLHFQKKIKLATAIQCINLGFYMHNCIGTKYKLPGIIQNFIKDIKDKHLVLVGDYFHIKGSLLSAETDVLDVPKNMSIVQIELSTLIYRRQQLLNKIKKQGYESIKLDDIFELIKLNSSSIMNSLISCNSIQNNEYQIEQINKVAKNIAMIIKLRETLQHFILSYKQLAFKLQNNTFDYDSLSLGFYIFYQGIVGKNSFESSFMNTIEILSESIESLTQELLKGQNKQMLKAIDYKSLIYG